MSLFAFAMPGAGELMIILLIVMMVFGAGKLPSIVSELGKGIKSIRDSQKED